MSVTEAIILAGGLGTRLQSVFPDTPKCMAPVKGKPFLTYVLDYLISQGLNKAILSVGIHKDHIINYFGIAYKELLIEYAIEHDQLGTGGAVKLALVKCLQDQVFVLNGDTYFLPDLRRMEIVHAQTSADITIAAKYLPETERYGRLLIDSSGRITDFREKEPYSGSGWINGGIYLLRKQLFENFPVQKFSLENDVFKVSCATLYLQAFETDAFFLDMGIPEDYRKALTIMPESREE